MITAGRRGVQETILTVMQIADKVGVIFFFPPIFFFFLSAQILRHKRLQLILSYLV